jgi:integrase/recombinase XerD
MTEVTAPRRRRKHPRTLSSTEQARVFLVPVCSRDRALLCLLIDTGVRIGEAVRLQAEDILEETIIVNGKTGEREVPISQDTRRQILALADSGYIFRGQRGHLCRAQAYNVVHAALRASGLGGRKLGPHLLRHTLGRQWILNGGDLVSLQRILGHTSINTTRIYAELSMVDVIRQHHKFTPITAALAPTQGRLIAEAESIIRTMGREAHG